MKVLVVDDDPAIARLLELNLELDGHQVIIAADGASGIRSVAQDAPDVVVLDIMLPGMDGFEVCRRITSDPASSHLPVVLLSARAVPADRDRGREVGAAGYVVKPFDPLGLTALLEDIVAARGPDA
jgi:DNA-binding response OmpR family regulator